MDRYKELKYKGKTYKQKYKINEILIENNLNWFLDCEIENVRIEIIKDTLVLNAGIFYNGVWEYGVIRDIDWRNGVFKNGVIYNGVFKKITVKKGIIFNGTFITGDILFSDIRGGDFKNVNISKNINKKENIQDENIDSKNEKEQTIPQTQKQKNVQIQGEITGQEGKEIQSQVQEKYVKTFENFSKKI